MIIDSPTGLSDYDSGAGCQPVQLFAFPTESNGDGTGRMAAYVKMTQVNKNVSDAQLDAIVKFWDFYYNAEENPEFSKIEQPIAIKGAELPEFVCHCRRCYGADGCLRYLHTDGPGAAGTGCRSDVCGTG